jgi:hypothetical protein
MRPIFLQQNFEKSALVVDQTERNFQAAGGNSTITGTAVKDTNIYTNVPWITDQYGVQLLTSRGVGSFGIAIYVASTVISRSGIITITDGYSTKYVTVNQEGGED